MRMALMLLDLPEASDAGRDHPPPVAVEVIEFDIAFECHFGTGQQADRHIRLVR